MLCKHLNSARAAAGGAAACRPAPDPLPRLPRCLTIIRLPNDIDWGSLAPLRSNQNVMGSIEECWHLARSSHFGMCANFQCFTFSRNKCALTLMRKCLTLPAPLAAAPRAAASTVRNPGKVMIIHRSRPRQKPYVSRFAVFDGNGMHSIRFAEANGIWTSEFARIWLIWPARSFM